MENTQPKIKKQIRITYLVDLEVDNIEQRSEEGVTDIDKIRKLLNKNGIATSGIVQDYEILSVEDIQEG